MTVKKFFQIYAPKRVFNMLLINIARALPLFPQWRGSLLKLAGVDIKGTVYIHNDVQIDTVLPNRIHIGNKTGVSTGTKIITHYLDIDRPGKHYKAGDVYIGEHVVLGMNVLICSPVTIGDGAIVGAGSVVTKNIPAWEVWAGNPAHFIKKRPIAREEDWT